MVLLVTGLVFAASLLLVVTVLAAVWGLRYAFARLTGRPINPFVIRIDPRAGFGRVYRRQGQGAAAAQAEPVRPKERVIGDVTDVEPKPPRDHG